MWHYYLNICLLLELESLIAHGTDLSFCVVNGMDGMGPTYHFCFNKFDLLETINEINVFVQLVFILDRFQEKFTIHRKPLPLSSNHTLFTLRGWNTKKIAGEI